MNAETYTIDVGPDGQPVQRRLEAMTADEVLQALAWHENESNQAHIAYEDAECVMTEVRFGEREPSGIEDAAQIMARAATASGRYLRLCTAIQAILRQRLGHPLYPELHFSMPFEEVVRLHWSDAVHSVI